MIGVQPHMIKCFDGIKALDFGPDPKSVDIYGMVSPEGEKVNLGKNLKVRLPCVCVCMCVHAGVCMFMHARVCVGRPAVC
jgi:hypothetical protein